MEQFNPDMRLIAVDERDLIVSFDSASANDHGRAAKALRIARDFAQLQVEVAGFADTEHAVLGERKQFQGVITLLVTGSLIGGTLYTYSVRIFTDFPGLVR